MNRLQNKYVKEFVPPAKGGGMEIEMKFIVIYLIAVNLFAFILYGADKRKAQNNQWRISEKMLIGIAAIGGSIGAILGMQVFRHKTKHWYFRYGIPAILLIQIVLAVWIISRIGK